MILVPGPPTEVKAVPINSTTVYVEWKPPVENERNGIIRMYHIHMQEIKHDVRALLVVTDSNISVCVSGAGGLKGIAEYAWCFGLGDGF